MIQHTDGTLALAVHRNEQGAVEQLVSTFQDAVFTYAYRLAQNQFDAQEVAQDTFIRAYHALNGRYDETQCRTLALKPWLFQITRNLASNRHRTRRRAHEGLPPIPEDLANSGPSPEQTVETSEELHRLDRALDGLDRGSRELITLRFIEEMSYTEIVDVVGTTESAVRGKVFRALRKLRTLMTEQEDNDDV